MKTMRYKILNCVVAIWQLCHGDTAAQQRNTGHVTLANGDWIPANIQAFDQDGLQFGSSLFAEQVQLKPQFVSSFGFHSEVKNENENDTGDANANEYLFRLKGDLHLVGELVSLDSSQCKINSSTIGRVVVPASELLEMSKRYSGQTKTIYSALNWQSLGNEFRPNSNGRILLGAKENNRLTLPNNFDGKLNCSIGFRVNRKTAFQIVLSDKNDKAVASVGVSNGDLVVEAGDDILFGEFKPTSGFARLTLAWADDQCEMLNELGQSVVKFRLKQNKSLGLSFQNEGSPLHINQIVIDSEPPQVVSSELADANNLVWNSTDKPLVANAIELKDGKLTYQNADDEKESVPVAKLDRVWFGGNRGSNQSTPHSAAKFTCLWGNGQKIACSKLSANVDELSFTTNQFESSGVLAGQRPREVFVNSDIDRAADASAAQTTDRGDGQFRLAISGIPFSGSYYWGEPENPVRWKFLGFIEPVTLNIDKKIKIKRVGSGSRSAKSESPDRLVLKDGSIIPCSVGSASETAIRFQSEKVSATSIPLVEFRCIFFNANSLRWRRNLTNETIQRALTLPRFSRDVGFAHVLVGKNGDLLRGNLIAIDAKEIEFESRLEPLRIPKTDIVGVIAIDTSITDTKDTTQNQTESTDPDPAKQSQIIARVDCGNDFIAVGKYISLDKEKAVLDSPVLGKLNLDAATIEQIAFNSRFQNVSTLQQFIDWRVNTAIEPRWSKEEEYAADANELLNQAAPNFEAPMLADSRSFRLSDHTGKIVIVNFWESTSKPSILGIPKYLNVIQQFSPRDVTFVAVNQGETASTITKFIESNDWSSLNIAMDYKREVSELYKVTGIPHLAIIDREGTIRFINVGYSSTSDQTLQRIILKLLGS